MNGSGMRGVIRELGTLFHGGAAGRLSDGQLLDRFLQRRDASAFEVILERYGPLVWGVCRRVLRDHHDAQDAFQATFLVLARKAASIVPREKLGNWLYGVGFQTAMKARATRAKRRVRERPAGEMTEPVAAPDEPADELLSRLDHEVNCLPEKYRLPIILCELEGKTHRQASEQLGWPVGTVSGRLSRARALLATRLSRPGMPLTIGALGTLLAQDVARAGVPVELVCSTARAMSLATAAKAVATAAVSADVAALAGEVLKTMLIHRLTLTTATLLVTLALAAGGTTLAYRAHATEPANRQMNSEESKEPSNPAEVAPGEIPPPQDRVDPAEAPKPDLRRPNAPERANGEPEELSSRPVEDRQGTRQGKLEYGGYSFTALQTGDTALAYNSETREVKAVRLNATKEQPLSVTPVIMECSGAEIVALGVKGERITRVAVFTHESGRWTPLDLDQPVNGVVWPMAFGPDMVAYEVGQFLYVLNRQTNTWDCLDLSTIADDRQEVRVSKGR